MKGKSKGAGKPKCKNFGNGNTYNMWDYDVYGLQFDTEPEDVTHLNLGKKGSSLGMLDRGATCSAGPETSIRNLIQPVISQDNGATINVDAKKRPRFRFGSGPWGQALYLIRIQSNITNKFFEAFVLPDPDTSLRPGLTCTSLGRDGFHTSKRTDH